MHKIDTIRGWLALGLAWLKEYTYELLPWMELLPPPYYLPITWDKFLRDEFLLTGTKALKVVHQLERELETAKPYIKMLGLTDIKVREAFAWISSRSFGMSLNELGGSKRSPVIPCGVDFPNHDIFIDSSLYYDHSFGENRFSYDGHMQNQEVVENIINNTKPGQLIKEIDFASNFLWINQDITNKSEIFINYGKYHQSSSRMALFGFIDNVHPYDHYTINLDLKRNDLNYGLKRKYFKTAWNSTWMQENKTIDWDKYVCFYKHDISTWQGLSRRPRGYQNVQNTGNKDEERVFGPPLSMEFYGQKIIRVHGNFLRFLRLAYLPKKYFDSFTISSILNDFEYDLLEKVLDPFVRKELNNVCKGILNAFPTTYFQDIIQLKQIEQERKEILKQLSLNNNKNLTETQRLSEIISGLDRHSVVLQYRVREKGFLDRCSYLDFEPTHKYLKSVKRNKKIKKYRKRMKQLKHQREINMTGNALSNFLRSSAIDFTKYITLNPRNDRKDFKNITFTNDTHNRLFNINDNNQNGITIIIDYVGILEKINHLIQNRSNNIDIDVFQTEVDEDLWSSLIQDAANSIIQDYYNHNNNNVINVEIQQSIDDDIEDDDIEDDDDDDDDNLDIIENREEVKAAAVVSKNDLIIGSVKEGRKHMAETIGWNSPKAGLNGASKGNGQPTITFANMNGQPLDLSSLFGGNGASFTINGGNIQIQNGQITMNGGNNFNNLLSQFGININNDNNNNDNNNNGIENERALIDPSEKIKKPEIPETVPFTQLMTSATVAVFSMDTNGNLVSVGNTMNQNNMNNLNHLGTMFNNNRKQNKPKP